MNELMTQQPAAQTALTTGSMLANAALMESLHRFAVLMSESRVTVPVHLHGNVPDCMAVAMQSAQWGMNPFVVAQKTHIVSGRMGYEAQLVNAVVQSSGAIRGAFRYEFEGTGSAMACRVGAVLAGEQEVTWGEWLKSSDVQTKNSPLWKVNPRQQMGYLQVKNWARLYCPGAILGVYTPDELVEVAPAPAAPRHMGDLKRVDVAPAECPDALRVKAEEAALNGVEAYRQFFAGLSRDDRKALASLHEGLKQAAAEADAERAKQPAAAVEPAAAEQAADDFVAALAD
jgi:hypothetical protein